MGEPADSALLLTLHERLLSGDRTVLEELITLVLDRLVDEMARKFPTTDRQLVYDGVADALLDLGANPDGFDTTVGVPLDRFLAKAAWRNIANLIRGEQRRRVREAKAVETFPHEFVELHPSAGNIGEDESERRVTDLLQMLKDPVDQKVFKLQMNGERKTEEFAKVMRISHLSVPEQRLLVKQAKDRILVHLKRKKDR
jgi:DNA-directed RNA polymerase specialized sigma24 family protein